MDVYEFHLFGMGESGASLYRIEAFALLATFIANIQGICAADIRPQSRAKTQFMRCSALLALPMHWKRC